MNFRCKNKRRPRARKLTTTHITRLIEAASRRQLDRLKAGGLQCAHKERELAALRLEREQMQEIVQGAASRVIEEQERTETILSALGQGLFGLDGRGCVQFLNSACERMMGWSEEHLQGIPVHDLIHPPHSRVTPCSDETCPLLGVLAHAVSQRLEQDTFRRRDGSSLSVSYFCTPIFRSGVQVGALICFDDITERLATARALDECARQVAAQNEQLYAYCEELTATQKCLEQQAKELTNKNVQIVEANQLLQSLASTDGMTGLANHRAFQEAIHTVWNAGRKQSGAQLVSLMIVDVDHFKSYNDSFGHQAGDAVLKTLAGLLRENMRESDLVARYGGEEFVIIAWDADNEAAMTLANRLCAVIEQHPFPHRNLTVSIGVATQDGRDGAYMERRNCYNTPDELIKAADESLYEAKRAGRNQVRMAVIPARAAKPAVAHGMLLAVDAENQNR